MPVFFRQKPSEDQVCWLLFTGHPSGLESNSSCKVHWSLFTSPYGSDQIYRSLITHLTGCSTHDGMLELLIFWSFFGLNYKFWKFLISTIRSYFVKKISWKNYDYQKFIKVLLKVVIFKIIVKNFKNKLIFKKSLSQKCSNSIFSA